MNLIKPVSISEIGNPACKTVTDCSAIECDYHDYLVDESRLAPEKADRLYFPSDTRDVSCVLRDSCLDNKKILVSGARTGIVGGAVAREIDCIISLQNMTKILSLGENSVTVQAGVTLDILNEYLEQNASKMFYPVDPTETTCSIGGNVATNASGARTYHYGPTRDWVNGLTVVLANGSVLRLIRGQIQADSRTFVFQIENDPKTFIFPHYEYPEVKNTTGIILTENMDALDLFIGSEGILGVITEIELRLTRKPSQRLYTVIWTQTEDQTLLLVDSIKNSKRFNPLAIEYFDPMSVALLKNRRLQDGESSGVPRIDKSAKAALFIDLTYENEGELSAISDELELILNRQGLSIDNTWSGLEDRDLQRMKALRHALPETINSIVASRNAVNPDIVKLSTDLAVPDGVLREMLRIYRDKVGKTGIEYVIFGHIGNNHLHMNMMPESSEELRIAKVLYDELASDAVRLGGVIAAEHGIGRLKRHLMKIQYPSQMIDSMWNLKNILDPNGILNPGVLLPDP